MCPLLLFVLLCNSRGRYRYNSFAFDFGLTTSQVKSMKGNPAKAKKFLERIYKVGRVCIFLFVATDSQSVLTFGIWLSWMI